MKYFSLVCITCIMFSTTVLSQNAALQSKKTENQKKEADINIDAVSKVQNDRVMFLNAYNFDFGSTSLSSNYVGHLNLFSPSIINSKWGFNTGIMKIGYGQKDTSNAGTSFLRENVFINPFDTLAPGTKYLKQINNYRTEKKNTVWSFYVQPLYEFTETEATQHIYGHVHLELVASKWTGTTIVGNRYQDTGIYAQPANGFVIRSRLSDTSIYNINSLSGYFGAGFTFDLRPWAGGGFFFQPTIGITSASPSPSTLDISSAFRISSGTRAPVASNGRNWSSFYLVRAYYTHVINEATIIVGTDIRGLLPMYSPQYAAYVGLNIGIDSILGILGATTKNNTEK